MKRLQKLLTIMLISIISITPTLTYAAPPTPPSDGNGPGGNPPGSSSSTSVSYSGKTKITKDTTASNQTYSSSTGSQNALLVSGGTSTIKACTINKTGDSDGDNSDFYGTNAGILVYNGATLNINGGSITTNGSHANAVFAYGKGTINISDSTIKTTSNNSGAIMVTGGGTLTANNVTAETDGNSSAPIRSDRGGGTLTVNGGTYTSHGTGSPVIYSTADITVNNAKLTSTASEGVVVEGKNSVTLNNTTMEATNTKLNGNSETYKSIFIYQSMSGDADEGTSSFTAKNSKITNNKGDIIFVTNTSTVINLENNEIVNNDNAGNFLKIGAAKWGNSGSNGGNVILNLSNQKAEGNIIVDNISTLDLNISNKSVLKTAIDTANEAKKINLTMSKDSVLVLTGDTYVDSLTNELEDNSNIYLNGYKLYVNGKETSANTGTYKEETSVITNQNKTTKKQDNFPYIIGGITGGLIIIATSILIIKKRNKFKNIKF